MYFREYSTNSDTLKEWAKQLNIANKGNYALYPTVESTLLHWKTTLNNTIGVNTFDLSNNTDSTIRSWKEKLNGIYNR